MADRAPHDQDPGLRDPELRARFALVERFEGGEGWSAAVRDRRAGNAVRLLKVLPAGEDLHEASLLVSLAHRQIPRILEIGRTAAGEPFLLREFFDGEPLGRVGTMQAAEAVALAMQLLQVLAFVHLRSILHLDIKPGNVLRCPAPAAGGDAHRYCLLDFGMGVRGPGRGRGGTPFFAAPELLLGVEPDARSDLFSVGALLWVMLRPSPPPLRRFIRRFPQDDFFRALGADPAELPPPFDGIVPRLVARRPSERFADAQEALEAFASGTGRPSLHSLALDPIAVHGRDLEHALATIDEGVDLELRGGTADDRRALALFGACELGDVRGIAEDGDATVLHRGGPTRAVVDLRPLDATEIAAHLSAVLALEPQSAADAAAALRQSGAQSASGLSTRLRGLAEAAEILPDGTTWIWPAALSGRLSLELGAPIPARADALCAAAAAGHVEQALRAYATARTADAGVDRQLRGGLVEGLLQAGEPLRALPLAHDLPLLRARCQLDLGQVAEVAGQLDQVGQPGHVGQPDPSSSQHAELARLRARVHYLRGEIDEALAELDERASAPEDRIVRGIILAATRDRLHDAAAVFAEALDSLPAAARPFLRAAALTNLGNLQRQQGDLTSARACHAEALDLYRGLGNVRHTANVSLNLGVVAKDLGDIDGARAHLRRARALFEHVKDLGNAAIAEANLGIVNLEAGDPTSALRRLGRAATSLDALGAHHWHPLLTVLTARAHATLGNADAARELVAEFDPGGDERLQRELETVHRDLQALWATRDGATPVESPSAEPPSAEPPSAEPPSAEPPSAEPPSAESPSAEPPSAESPSAEPPSAESPSAEDQTPMSRSSGTPPGSDDAAVPKSAFRTFLAVNRRLASEADLQKAMTYLLEAAVTLSGARDGYLLVADQGGSVRLELSTDAFGGRDRAFSRSLANKAVSLQRVLSAEDALSDREIRDMPSVRALEVKSALCVPFLSSTGTAGALYVEHSGRSGVFGDAEKEYLEILADQAAIAVDRMLHEAEIAEKLERSQRDLEVAKRKLKRRAPPRMIGASPPMAELSRQIEKFAATELAVLIHGETGSGKELVAQAIHENSAMRGGPFISENCSAIPPDLMESELFGHCKGAFTGADQDRAGLLELATGGTLFLDEVGDMPTQMQVKLLRALQERHIRRVGGSDTIAVDVRLVSATHRDLGKMIEAGEFREDLYFRIAAGVIRVPPLRERGDDILLLARAFLDRLNRENRRELRLDEAAEQRLCAYRWPGNVRELEHMVARAFILSDGDRLDPRHLPAPDAVDAPGAAGQDAAAAWPVVTLQEAEIRTIEAALRATDGDKSKAARILGISRTALYDKLKRSAERGAESGTDRDARPDPARRGRKS